ncbi:MAG TPA: hypothetical protein VK453_25930, partial [Micromonosporaceae bacterium]|nr:hypothetical protein [Micromonosporaceae bacterium]
VEPDLRSALRRMARDRVPLRIVLVDGTGTAGTVDRVGIDFIEFAEHVPGEPRRAAAVTGVRVIPFAGLGAVRRW